MKVVGKKQTMISRVAAGKSGSGPLKLLPGLQNSADLSSKLFFNAIEKINSDLYRKGPLSFTNPNDIKISIKDGEQWLDLPAGLIMKERRKNTISLKDTKAGETFGNVVDIKD